MSRVIRDSQSTTVQVTSEDYDMIKLALACYVNPKTERLVKELTQIDGGDKRWWKNRVKTAKEDFKKRIKLT